MKDEYKTVCDTCYMKTWYETEQPCKRTVFKGCATCGSHENIDEPFTCTGTLRVIGNSELDERFTRFYKTGERVEVIEPDGTKTRFYVGRSTGWKPIYLEISRKDSRGGGGVYASKDAVIRGTGTYR